MPTAINAARRSSKLNLLACFSMLVALAAGTAACGSAGEKGAPGTQGPVGNDGTNGQDGMNGADGTDGTDGKDGTSATVDPSLSPLDKAFTAIGGKDALLKLASYSYHAKGERVVDGEGFMPGEPFTSSTFDIDVKADIVGQNLRIDNTRTTYLFGPVPQTLTEYIKGDVGYIDGMESLFGIPSGNMASARWASTLRQQRFLNPHLILQDAAADASIAKDGGVSLLDGSIYHLLVINNKVHPITLYVNANTGRIAKASTVENDYLYRDRVLEAHYIGWEPTKSGLLFPKQVAISLGETVVHNEVRGEVDVNGALNAADFDFPAGANPTHDDADAQRGLLSHQFHQIWSGVGIPLDALQSFVMPTQLAPGVFHLTGGSHNSLAVEQANGVVVLEAPLYEDRSEAILAWAKTTFPGKPVTHLLITHHHEDHSAGARAFVAAGAKVIVGEATADFFADIFNAPSTIRPDALALSPKKAVIQPVPVGGSFTIPDATNPVTIYTVKTTHSADMLFGYVGGASQIVFVSDLYSPGLQPNPPAIKEVNDALTLEGITVKSFAGGHGGTGTFAEFQALVP